MRRREFLRHGSAALASAALAACDTRPRWKDVRVMVGSTVSEVELTAAREAQSLLEKAVGSPVALVKDTATPGPFDILIGCPESSTRITDAYVPPVAGGFRVRSGEAPAIVIAGRDAEGARNGVYALLEHLDFRFFRDGDTVPDLSGAVGIDVDLRDAPAFRWRGDMIWDHYIGPRRYCASVWDEDDWDRALSFMVRNRMNFLEFYPPLESIYARVFPDAHGLDEGSVWKAEVKHALAKHVLARARALGIHCMYVLAYGAFPEPVRKLYPQLEWRNGFLCAHQPELQEMTRATWRALVEELDTDHWYAIRHRGEEEQVYSDPCRSVSKAEGFLQAFSVMKDVDPDARVTVWTWGETIPALFETFPENVRAAHIRHGMADVFADRSAGREQLDGRPNLPPDRKWLSGQFTVFGGNETLLQTGWSDPVALARDAQASVRDGSCEGYFQWPEWSNTSPWLSHVIAKLSWRPESLSDVERALADYAYARHGAAATPFLEAFLPLVREGNARFMHPPRKRLLAPHEIAHDRLSLLDEVRRGARAMLGAMGPHRDVVDVVSWVAVRQAHAFEADAYVRHVEGISASGPLEAARRTWQALHDLLVQFPDLSIVESLRSASAHGELSSRVEDSFWTLGCDFYRGYPLVLSPEAIELVYLEQLGRLAGTISEAESRGETAVLEEPGWFWHDFDDPAWAECVRKLPTENETTLEHTLRERFQDALRAGATARHGLPVDVQSAETILALELPSERISPPQLPAARAPERD